jgi:hypothetical protein
VTGYPRVDMTDEEHAYLYNGSVSQACNELKLDTHTKTEDADPTSNTDNTTCNLTDDKSNEKDIIDSKKRFYCIDCSTVIEDEVVSYDSTGHPVVRHNNGHTHRVMFQTDIRRLLELSTSQHGESAIYETAEMYGIPVEKLEQILANIGEEL